MHHNSIFEVILSHPEPLPTTAPSRGSSPSSLPSKRFKESPRMSSSDRPKLLRPPSSARSAQMLPPREPLSRRRPAPPRQSSSTEGSLNLKLPDVHLGRYHPINFSSQHSSIAGTPSSGLNSPQAPLSPRTHQRQLSEAERRLHEYYRDRAVASGKTNLIVNPFGKPTSPRLEPAGSPGPVTPLELEASNSYFGAKSTNASMNRKSPDRLGCQGAMRRSMSPRTPPIGSY